MRGKAQTSARRGSGSPTPRRVSNGDDPARPDWRLATGVLDLSPESFSALSEACDWLTDFLSAGPRSAREVLGVARASGIRERTLFRAKRILGRSVPQERWDVDVGPGTCDVAGGLRPGVGAAFPSAATVV